MGQDFVNLIKILLYLTLTTGTPYRSVVGNLTLMFANYL